MIVVNIFVHFGRESQLAFTVKMFIKYECFQNCSGCPRKFNFKVLLCNAPWAVALAYSFTTLIAVIPYLKNHLHECDL